MAAPVVYPVAPQFGGIAKEGVTTPGTAVPMTNTLNLDVFKWEDKPVWLEDKAYRGVMGNDSFGEIQGVEYCDISSIGGPVYVDTLPFLLGNILGDMTDSGTGAPYSHKAALLNPTSSAPTAQGTTHTLTAYYGPTATVGARVFSYFCLSQLVLTWDNATKMLTWSGKGNSFASQPAAARPVAAPSALKPFAGWQSQFAVGGVNPANSVKNLERFTITFNREIENEFTGNNTQTPLAIARGGLAATWQADFLAQDEAYLTDMLNNTQPQIQSLFTVGSAGTLQSVQIDAQQAAFTKAAPDMSKKMVRWSTSGKCVFNSTNVGTSAGLGPATVTVQNAVVTGTYV